MKTKRTAIPYASAIKWLVNNDDTEFLNDLNPALSVAASLVADIYGRTDEEILEDLIKESGHECRIKCVA